MANPHSTHPPDPSQSAAVSSPSHTPGPWEHNADEEPACCRLTISKDGAPLAEVLNVDDFPCLADDDDDDDAKVRAVDEQARADARLIAAAPDLLAACRAAVVWTILATARDRETTHPEAITNAKEDLALLQAAIAKAEGADPQPREPR